MIYHRSERFKRSFKALPRDVQEKAIKAFSLFKQNPWHPSLGVKRIKGTDKVWEGRVDAFYRFTFHYEDDPLTGERICLFRNIGRHEILADAP